MRITVVAIRAIVAIRFQVFLSALADTRLLLAVSSQVEAIAIARLANVSLVPVTAVGAVILGRALVAVGAHRIVLTVLTDTTTLVVTVDIQRCSITIHFLVIFALRRMSMTVAS